MMANDPYTLVVALDVNKSAKGDIPKSFFLVMFLFTSAKTYLQKTKFKNIF
jgi:hypothetical protein